MDNQLDDKFDRGFKYDQIGRLQGADFGNSTAGVPLSETATYTAFGDLSGRATTHWGTTTTFIHPITNGRQTSTYAPSAPIYDAAGNLQDTRERSNGTFQTTTFDAANHQKATTSRYKRDFGEHTVWTYEDSITEYYDGDGRSLKSYSTYDRLYVTPAQHSEETRYRIWSSVLNAALTSVKDTGLKDKTNVFAGGAVVATQSNDGSTQAVGWTLADPVTGSSPDQQFEPFG